MKSPIDILIKVKSILSDHRFWQYVILFVGIAVVVAVRCNREKDFNAEIMALTTAYQKNSEFFSKQLEEIKEREKNRDEEFDKLKAQIEKIDSDIAQSIEEREATHEAIGSASSIDDVDRIIRSGSGSNGKRRK